MLVRRDVQVIRWERRHTLPLPIVKVYPIDLLYAIHGFIFHIICWDSSPKKNAHGIGRPRMDRGLDRGFLLTM